MALENIGQVILHIFLQVVIGIYKCQVTVAMFLWTLVKAIIFYQNLHGEYLLELKFQLNQ